MEPFTIIGISLFVFLLNSYGRSVITFTAEMVQESLRYIFKGRNIAILGEKSSGKTSLIYFLQYGKPVEIKQNKVNSPEPTLGSVVVGANINLKSKGKEVSVRIPNDVSGDNDFRALWKELIKDTNPDGIIYLLDGRLNAESTKVAIASIFKDILSCYSDKVSLNGVSDIKLKAFHIFVSYSDRWATSEAIRTMKEAQVKLDYLSESDKEEHKYLKSMSIKFDVSIMNLSPNKNNWNETIRALTMFGTDLN
ncbi:MAG: hypothetical protein HC903_28980 [Methylacidiphilales bacterium]|nr:hypothetical protein [Candidatus Methylacidiphilales bacterium]NJR18717.1 hypothetical protein [Calothrix sp. CSU_2_0]